MSGQNILHILQKDPRYKDLEQIFSVLQNAGHEIYLVGGCVRDALLGRDIHDYDFTTSALPDEVQSLFAKTLDHGKAFGTITLVLSGHHYEVTTFRMDMNYNDHRRPESINYSRSYIEDSQRRDFTINALYANAQGEVLDPQDGLTDLGAKRIKCVGGGTLQGAKERFEEDALRMYRALRFASQLNFHIESLTEEALFQLWSLTAHISKERRYQEFKKMVMSRYFYDHLPTIFAQGLLPYTSGKTNVNYLVKRMTQNWEPQMKFKVFVLEWVRLEAGPSFDRAQEMLTSLKQVLSLSKDENKWLSSALHLLCPPPAVFKSALRDFIAWSGILSVPEMRLFFIPDVGLESSISQERLLEFQDLLGRYTEIPRPLVTAQDLMDFNLTGQKLGEALSEIYQQQILGDLTEKEPLLQWFLKHHS